MVQNVEFSLITACGECCIDCRKKQSGLCEGCIEADGYVPEWKESGRCRVHACTREHGVQFCGLCAAFPCGQLETMIHWNPNFIEQQKRFSEAYKKEKLNR